jgi:7-cyano-7-deazaguanine synthase
MGIVTLVSGGLDSTLVSVLIKEQGIEQHPLFIDYGQLCKNAEWDTCRSVHKKYDLPEPKLMNIKGFGETIASGLTNSNLRINEDAFLPGRNLLFLIVGAAYACQTDSNSVAIGLLSEEYHLFPDQTESFIKATESLINVAMQRNIKILTPLMQFSKEAVVKLAQDKKIEGTYSCHAGTYPPCGKCVSCLEFKNSFKKEI